LPEGFTEDAAEFAKDDIAGGVAVVVVQSFETIDIDDGDSQLLLIAACSRKFDGETIVDVATIEKSGERIAGGELEEPLAAGHKSEAEGRRGGHHNQAGNLRGPAEKSVGIWGVGDVVEIPVGGGEINDRKIFAEGEKTGSDANAFVVTEAGAADGEEIAFENDFAVDGGVRLVEIKKSDESDADERDVETASGEGKPRGIVFAGDQKISNDRNSKGGGGKAETDHAFFGIDGKAKGIDNRNEEKNGGKSEANFRDEEFASDASLGKDGVRTRP
jgi:hypothetical protein